MIDRAGEPRGLDANVLIYSIAVGAPQQPSAAALIEQARQADAALYVVPQVLFECYAVITNPRRFEPAFAPEEARAAALSFLALPGLTLLPPPVDLVSWWAQLTRRCAPSRQHTFDVVLAATYLAHEVTALYTFNTRDFEAIPGLRVLDPATDVPT